MEEFRIKHCLVLPVVFSFALGITLGCKPPKSDKPAPATKNVEKPSVPEEETKAQTEGGSPKPVAAEMPNAKANEKDLPPTPKAPADKSPSPKAPEPKAPAPEAPAVKAAKPVPPKPPAAKTDTAGDAPKAKKPDDAKKDTKAPAVSPEPAKAAAEEPDFEDEIPRDETPQETAKRLGPPLVEQPDKLKRFDPVDSIWVDKAEKRVVMVGEVCQRKAPLEMFVCLWHTKEHESVLTVRVPAKAAHAALLLVGAKQGNPVQFMPKYVPASGSVIDIEVAWKDAKGKIKKARAQDWIRDFRTKKPMKEDWVFGGSGFWTDKKTGVTHYQAKSGDFICVSNFSTAMLDLPVKSTDSNTGLMFEAFTENIPPLGTPVTIFLKPRLEKSEK